MVEAGDAVDVPGDADVAVAAQAIKPDAPMLRLGSAGAGEGGALLLLLLGYGANWLPFVVVDRAAFLYHFLPSLLYGLLLAGAALDALVPPAPLMQPPDEPTNDPLYLAALRPGSLRWLVCAGCVLGLACSFAFFAPLAYGVPLSDRDFEARLWTEGWR